MNKKERFDTVIGVAQSALEQGFTEEANGLKAWLRKYHSRHNVEIGEKLKAKTFVTKKTNMSLYTKFDARAPVVARTKGNPRPEQNAIAAKATVAPFADDLTKIEGIGPATQADLYDAGIRTYQRMTVENMEAFNDPGTWAKQAEMAANGEWDELEAYQDTLDGGKEPKEQVGIADATNDEMDAHFGNLKAAKAYAKEKGLDFKGNISKVDLYDLIRANANG